MSPRRVEGGMTDAVAHLQKAKEFLDEARVAFEAGRFDAAVSAAAIAGVNASDVVTLVRVGTRSASGSHSDALELLQESGGNGNAMAASLGTLLTYKNPAQYQNRLFNNEEAADAITIAASMVDLARPLVILPLDVGPVPGQARGAVGRFLRRLFLSPPGLSSATKRYRSSQVPAVRFSLNPPIGDGRSPRRA